MWLDRSTVRDKGQQVIYDGDLAEVEFARRLLHRWVWSCGCGHVGVVMHVLLWSSSNVDLLNVLMQGLF